MPPPTTTTWGRVVAAGADMPSASHARTEPSTRPGAGQDAAQVARERGPAACAPGPAGHVPGQPRSEDPVVVGETAAAELQDCPPGPAGAGSSEPTGDRSRPATPFTACVEYEYASTAKRDGVDVDVERLEVDVVDGVARLVVALVERLTGDATPDRLLLGVLTTSAPVKSPPAGMPAWMNAW